MKTKIFAVIAFMMLGLSLNANAQRLSYPRFHMGIRGGGTVNVDTDRGEPGVFPTIGIGMDFRLAPIPLYLETGAFYMNKMVDLGSNHDKDYDDTYNDHYIYAPLLASYHIYLSDKFCLQPFAGVTLGYLTESEMLEAAARVGIGMNFGRLYSNMGLDVSLTKHEWEDSGSYYTPAQYVTLFWTIGVNWAGSR